MPLSTRFMQRWLRAGALCTIAAGLTCLGAASPTTATPWTLAMDLAHWPLDAHPGAFDFAARASSAMLGGVMAGWGTMLLLIPYRPDCKPALLVWFVTDCIGSVACGFYGNLVVNLLFLVVLAPPILQLGRSRK